MDYLQCPFAIEMKSDDEADGFISGYGSTFGGPPDLQGDIMVRGCFAETIEERKGWPMLFSHSMAKCCGFWTNAHEDNKGLYLEGQLTLDSPEGAAAAAICRHGAKLGLPFGLSIGYSPKEDGWKLDNNGVRKLTKVALWEVSLVPCPANVRARVRQVKSDAMWTERDFEEYLRDAGLSREAAKRFVLRGYRALNDQREADDGAEKQAGAGDAFLAELRQLQFQSQLKELIKWQ